MLDAETRARVAHMLEMDSWWLCGADVDDFRALLAAYDGLAALAAAARAWAAACDDRVYGWPDEEGGRLYDAIYALAAPPGETPTAAHKHCYCTLIQRKGEPKSYMACCQCGDEQEIPRAEHRVYVDADDAAPPGEGA